MRNIRLFFTLAVSIIMTAVTIPTLAQSQGTSMSAAAPTAVATSAGAASAFALGSTMTDPKGVSMVYVPAGCYMMGSDPGKDPGAESYEMPLHKACITKGFWLDKTLVTNAEYDAFVKAGGYSTQNLWSTDGWSWLQTKKVTGPDTKCAKISSAPDQPRTCINFYEAEAFAKWRGGRLPTEAEWEYAARGPQDFRYAWGDTFDQAKANTLEAGLGKTTAVCSYPAGNSWVGACDMTGNLWEWVTDWADVNSYVNSKMDDPTGVPTGENRAMRGGAWDFDANYARTSYRSYSDPSMSSNDYGFRIVIGT